MSAGASVSMAFVRDARRRAMDGVGYARFRAE